MILEDRQKIMEILSQPECADFFDGREARYTEGAIYIYHMGCLFPSVQKDIGLSMHAAIPPENRGLNAVLAGKEVISWVHENLNNRVISRIYKHRKHVNMYARMVGMTYTCSDNKYHYYEAVK